MYFMQTRPPVPLSWLVALSDRFRSSRRVGTSCRWSFVRTQTDVNKTCVSWRPRHGSSGELFQINRLAVLLFMKTLWYDTSKLISTQRYSCSLPNGNTYNKVTLEACYQPSVRCRARRLKSPAGRRRSGELLRYSSFLHPGRTQREDEHEREHEHGTAECLKGVQTVV